MSRKPSGLGRGLEALLPKTGAGVVRLPLASIRPNPRQPRKRFAEESLKELGVPKRQVHLERFYW